MELTDKVSLAASEFHEICTCHSLYFSSAAPRMLYAVIMSPNTSPEDSRAAGAKAHGFSNPCYLACDYVLLLLDSNFNSQVGIQRLDNICRFSCYAPNLVLSVSIFLLRYLLLGVQACS